jgi:PBP1b-binding outer membrane lipoprotein LpoB
MKLKFAFAAIAWALLLGGCADQSLMTDEEYKESRKPAPFSPDFSGVLPDPSTGRPAGGY